jgi:streptomycin 6-kinase
MPSNLVDAATAEGRTAWLATVPERVSEVADRWSLDVGEPFQPGGSTAWVGPVRSRSSGLDLVLKVAWRHPEAEHEAEGLRVWEGEGAVRLHAATSLGGDTVALLLERCVPGSTLATRPEDEQDVVVAGLLRRLWLPLAPGHPFRTLRAMCDAWAHEAAAKVAARGPSLDPALLHEGIALFRSLPATAERSVLLATDLHAENVLAAEREPWLVIDPKPHVGDPTYDPLQHMLNCAERLHADPHGLARRMADLLARCVVESPDWPDLAHVAQRLAPALG